MAKASVRLSVWMPYTAVLCHDDASKNNEIFTVYGSKVESAFWKSVLMHIPVLHFQRSLCEISERFYTVVDLDAFMNYQVRSSVDSVSVQSVVLKSIAGTRRRKDCLR